MNALPKASRLSLCFKVRRAIATTLASVFFTRWLSSAKSSLRLSSAPMQALEHAEQLICVSHIETHAVVTDRIDGFRRRLFRPHLDDDRITASAVFRRVRDQIDPDLTQHGAVPQGLGEWADAPFDLAAFQLGVKRTASLPEKRIRGTGRPVRRPAESFDRPL